MSRKVLKYSVGLMLVVAIVFVAVLFGQSLSPSEMAKSQRSMHDVSDLKNGTFRFDEYDGPEGSRIFNNAETVVLLFKTNLGELRIFVLPANNGLIALPDRFMRAGEPVHQCQDFRPTLTAGGVIQCHDADMQKWNDNMWVWDLDGVSAYLAMDDLPKPEWEQIDQKVYLNF